MAYEGVILFKKEDQVIPTPLLSLVTGKFKSCAGCGMVDSDDNLVREAKSAIPDVATIEATQRADGFKSAPMVYYFGNWSEKKTHEDDLQPFVLLRDKDGNRVLVACLEGDYSEYAHKESTRSPAWFCAQEHLIPKIEQLWELVDGNVDKLVAQLKKPIVQKELRMGEGTIAMMANNGDIMFFTNGENRLKQFDWGAVSGIDYEEKEYPAAAAAEANEDEDEELTDEEKAVLAKMKAKKEAKNAAATAGEKKEKQFIATKDMPFKAAAMASTSLPSMETVLIGCPPEITHDKAKKNWYHHNFGYCPADYRLSPKLPASKLKPAKIKDFKELAAYLDLGPPQEVQHPTAKPTPASQLTVPIISAEEKKLIQETLLKEAWVDKASKTIMDPKKMQELVRNYEPFHEACGLPGLTSVFNWPREGFKEFCSIVPEASAELIVELINEIMQRMTPKEVAELNAKIETVAPISLPVKRAII